MPSEVDSACIAGLIDLLRTRGLWLASVRFGYVYGALATAGNLTELLPSLHGPREFAQLASIFDRVWCALMSWSQISACAQLPCLGRPSGDHYTSWPPLVPTRLRQVHSRARSRHERRAGGVSEHCELSHAGAGRGGTTDDRADAAISGRDSNEPDVGRVRLKGRLTRRAQASGVRSRERGCCRLSAARLAPGEPSNDGGRARLIRSVPLALARRRL